jgi:hypothetical protein
MSNITIEEFKKFIGSIEVHHKYGNTVNLSINNFIKHISIKYDDICIVRNNDDSKLLIVKYYKFPGNNNFEIAIFNNCKIKYEDLCEYNNFNNEIEFKNAIKQVMSELFDNNLFYIK